MKKKFTLHKAMEIVLLGQFNKTASLHWIATEIEKRGLYYKKNGNPAPPSQIRSRATGSNGFYKHLFEFIIPDKIKLR